MDISRKEKLIGEAKNGSSDAINVLINSIRTYLLLVANAEIEPDLRQKVAASDLVQDVCLAAAEQFRGFRGTSENELHAWTRKILLNSMRGSRRKFIQSQKRATSREVAFDPKIGTARNAKSPRASMIAEEEARQLQQAMQRLSNRDRLVLKLRNWELLPFDAIANQMNLTAAAAQKLWTRALCRLEKELDTR